MEPTTPLRYATFWKRFNAYGIDATIVLALSLLIGWIFGIDAIAQTEDLRSLSETVNAMQGGALDPALQLQAQTAMTRSLTGGSFIALGDENLFMAISAIYNIFFVAGNWRATPGKRWCGIEVLTQFGAPLTLVQSALRHAASGLSMMAGGLGTLTIFFTDKKLALHDMLCGTCVVMRTTPNR